jgi:ATP-dependent DNA helicase RecQ
VIKPLSEREVGNQLISETVAFAESGVCRRKILLSYFGEEYEKRNVAIVITVFIRKKKLKQKDEVVCALKAIKALDERFAMEYVVNMIFGRPTPQITMYPS